MKDLKVAELIGLGSAVAFVLTILYLHGYSRALGVNLFLYFSLNDYTRLAIEWLPPVFVVGFFGVLMNKFFTRVERGASEEELAAATRYPKFIRRFRQSGDAALFWMPLIIAALYTGLSVLNKVPR